MAMHLKDLSHVHLPWQHWVSTWTGQREPITGGGPTWAGGVAGGACGRLIRRAKGAVIAPMESELFGEVVDGLGGAKEEELDEEDAARERAKKEDADTSAWEEIRALVQMAIRVQEAFGDFASVVERIQRTPRLGTRPPSAINTPPSHHVHHIVVSTRAREVFC